MGNHKIIIPWAASNLVHNPSFEIGLTRYTTFGAAAVAWERQLAKARRGIWAARYVSAVHVAERGFYYEDPDYPAAGTYSFAFDARTSGAGPDQWAFRITLQDGGALVLYEANFSVTDKWKRFEFPGIVCAGDDLFRLYWVDKSASSHEIFIDGIQWEAGSYCTSYLDGDLPGHRWAGARCDSNSSRPDEIRSGGRIMDLDDDYGFKIETASGVGVASIEHLTEPLALLPGDFHQGIRIDKRDIVLSGRLAPASPGNDQFKAYIAARAALIRALRPSDNEPLQYLFTGGEDTVQIACRYRDGLDAGRAQVSSEAIALRLEAVDPLFISDDKEVHNLTHHAGNSRGYISRRTNGEWLDAGPSALNNGVRVIAYDRGRNYWYIGGYFTTIGATTFNRLARWTGSAWAAMGTGGAYGVNGAVYGFAVAPDGRLAVVGAFTQSTTGVTYNRFLWYTPSTNGFTAQAPNNCPGAIRCVAIDPDNGDLYLGGDFIDWGSPNGDYIVRIRVSDNTVQPLGTGLNGVVRAMRFLPNGKLLVAGDFATTGNGLTTLNRIAYWNRSTGAMEPIKVGSATGANGAVSSIAMLSNGDIILAGAFTTIGGFSCANIAKYTGATFFALGAGVVAGGIDALAVDSLDQVWIGGTITAVGDLTSVGRVAVFTGGAWAHPDIALGAGDVLAIEAGLDGDLMMGHDTADLPATAKLTTINNNGTVEVNPDIVFDGGTNSIGVFYVCNESLPHKPKALFASGFGASAGEVITVRTGRIDGSQEQIESSWRRPGLMAKLLNGSDLAGFYLRPGPNRIAIRSNSVLATVYTLVAYEPKMISRDTD